jgi:hypothetical protein
MLLSVDPGVKTMGMVVLQVTHSGQVEIAAAHVVDLGPNDKRPFDKQIENLIYALEIFAAPFKITEVACEYPIFFQNRRGMDTAAKGNLVEMAYCVGCVSGWARSFGATFIPVPVTDWKGQLPKPVVNERIAARIDTSLLSKKSHDWDACGIGLYVKGKF